MIRQLLDADEQPQFNSAQLLKDLLFSDPVYNFVSEAERLATFKHLKSVVQQKRASQWVQPRERPNKSQDQNYVQNHYTLEIMSHVYENAADLPPMQTIHHYENE